MSNFLSQVWTDIRMQFRIPISVFFSIVFPTVILVMVLTTSENVVLPDGSHVSDHVLMITATMGFVPLAFVSFPVWICSSYENNYLIRLKYFHISLSRVASSGAIAHAVVAFCGLIVNIAVAMMFYQASIVSAQGFLLFLLETLVVLLALMAFGCALGFLVHRASVALGLGLILMFFVFMITGSFGNYDTLPAGLKAIADWIPVKYLAQDAFDVWRGTSGFNLSLLGVSGLWIAIGGIVAALLARRGPHKQKHQVFAEQEA